MSKPKRFPVSPAHPERNCWGCDQYCAASDMRCGNGSERTAHPIELHGPEWLDSFATTAHGAADAVQFGVAQQPGV